ncbi:menaquinone biosynthesis family protein [Thermoproteota archaeon]
MNVRVGRSPDADDAFMYYALVKNKVNMKNVEFTHIVEDIESLNKRSFSGELDVTAISANAYGYVSDKYYVLSVGSSQGKGYGPILVARNNIPINEIPNKTIAIPGKLTTANLILKMAFGDLNVVEMSFDKIMGAVVRGDVDIGLVIHEGQITHKQYNLTKILDLGEWWDKETGGQPLPLGLDVSRKELGIEFARDFRDVLRNSIQYAFNHKEDALDYAMQYARDVPRSIVERFVYMYVNDLTVNMGEIGEQALQTLFDRASKQGFLPSIKLELI